MKHPYRHRRFIRRRIRHGVRRSFRRGGRLLGLVGLAALGVTLLNKHQREGQRGFSKVYVDDTPQDWKGGGSAAL